MSTSPQGSPDRREFLTHIAAAAVVMAGTACAPPLATASGQPGRMDAPARGQQPFDDSWARRVAAAKHRAVFDSPGVDDGLAFLHATFFREGFREQLGTSDDDVIPVVVLRHAGTALAFNDAIWEKYAVGERAKVKDPKTGKDALRNPFIRVEKDDKDAIVPQDASIQGLLGSGVVLLACNKAAMNYAGQMAKKHNLDAETVRNEIRNGIVPGILLQPSGIYATLRAQDVGCTFIKST